MDRKLPIHEHDCDCCVFLGTLHHVDLYFHRGEYETTVVARHSSEGGDYQSGLGFLDGYLGCATWLALNVELLTLDELNTHCNPRMQTNQLYFKLMTNVLPWRDKLKELLEELEYVKYKQIYGASSEIEIFSLTMDDDV